MTDLVYELDDIPLALCYPKTTTASFETIDPVDLL